ncbi:hypothetical protein KJ786_01875 [Patescibacteria group bacterium]|nr:hypothetical protein [Patescibacteria group bacterium]
MKVKIEVIEALVDLVVCRALVDKTTPNSSNLRNGWCIDALLGDIDAFVVIACNNPAAYAEIGRQMLVKVKNLPEIATLTRLAIFRGERLLPFDANRQKSLIAMAKKIKTVISGLPDGTRKLRLQSLLEYHTGVFYDACGLFDKAAQSQQESVGKASSLGDVSGIAIASFLEIFYRLKYALQKNKATGKIFTEMQKSFKQLVKVLHGSPFQVQWAEGNGPVHMIEACIWLDKLHPQWRTWVGTAFAASKKLGEAFKPDANFVRAVFDMDLCGNQNTGEALKAIAEGDSGNEVKATVLLILIRRAVDAGRLKEARSIMEKMPKQGTQHVCAIAKRLLAPSK